MRAAIAALALGGLVACGSQAPPPRRVTNHGAARRSDPPRAPTRISLSALAPPARPSSARSRDGLGALVSELAREMRRAGPASGAIVYDLTAQRVLFARRATTPRPPASVEKIYTSTAALALLGPDARLYTTLLGNGSLGAHGTWHGDIYLHGGGDPTFGNRGFDAIYAAGRGAVVETLAQRLRAAGIRRITGHVIADESLFDTERGPVAYAGAADLGDLGGQLSALTYNHGYVGPSPGRSWHAPLTPATYAALEFTRALGRVGVSAHPAQLAHPAPAGAEVLASVASPPLSVLLDLMNAPSDDFYAELLLKQLGVRFGEAGTSTAGAAVVTRVLAGYGLHPRIVDGSGLSHRDSTTPRDVVQLLVDVSATPNGAVLRRSLALAGVSGTLTARMRGTTAARRCEAKTGTLNDVTNLAGWCRDLSGHLIAFAFFMDGESPFPGHALQDQMLITIARDDPARA